MFLLPCTSDPKNLADQVIIFAEKEILNPRKHTGLPVEMHYIIRSISEDVIKALSLADTVKMKILEIERDGNEFKPGKILEVSQEVHTQIRSALSRLEQDIANVDSAISKLISENIRGLFMSLLLGEKTEKQASLDTNDNDKKATEPKSTGKRGKKKKGSKKSSEKTNNDEEGKKESPQLKKALDVKLLHRLEASLFNKKEARSMPVTTRVINCIVAKSRCNNSEDITNKIARRFYFNNTEALEKEKKYGKRVKKKLKNFGVRTFQLLRAYLIRKKLIRKNQ